MKWFTIILLIGNIFNVIANEGLRLNDLQKKLRILRRIDDIVSGLFIVLVWYYVLFSISFALCIAFIRSIIKNKMSVPLIIIYWFYFKDMMNFNFLLSVRKTDFNFSVIHSQKTQTLITGNVGSYWWFLNCDISWYKPWKIYWKMIGKLSQAIRSNNHWKKAVIRICQ